MQMKCPSCNSNNIKKIIYGLASDLDFIASKKGEVVLGGTNKNIDSPDFFCNSCKKSFKSKLEREIKENIDKKIKSFYFYKGGFCSPSYYIYLNANKNYLRYAYSELGMYIDLKKEEYEKNCGVYVEQNEISNQSIEELSQKLMELGVYKWNKEFVDLEIMDGVQWNIDIDFMNNSNFQISGSNKYPDKWENLLFLINKYSRKKVK